MDRVPENKNAGDARGTSGIGTLAPSFQYDSTHPPEPLLKALLHNDCTGKVPVDKFLIRDGVGGGVTLPPPRRARLARVPNQKKFQKFWFRPPETTSFVAGVTF
jgi:hypothetical protein